MATPDLTQLDGSEIFDNWDQLMGENTSSKTSDSELDSLMAGLESEEKGQDYWVDLFQNENFGGMDLMSAHYQPYTLNEQEFHHHRTAGHS